MDQPPNPPEPREIDCTGFNFHCPKDRRYVIFDPQSQEESDRLDALLGATPIWQETLEKQFGGLGEKSGGTITPFSRLVPVGWSTTGNEEVVAVVVAGAVGIHEGERRATGQWFGVRYRAETMDELTADLQDEVLKRREALIQELPPGSFKTESTTEEE